MENIKVYRNIVKLKDIDMFYLDTKTDGPVIICVHGLWGRAETWSDFINHYGKQYRIIAVDQRGHGLSSKPKKGYAFKEMAEDLAELLKFLKIDSAIFAGHSLGGSVVGNLAALYPEHVKGAAILDQTAAEREEADKYPFGKDNLIDPITHDWPLPFDTLDQAQEYIKHSSKSDLEYQYFMRSLTETVEGYQMMFCPKAMAAILANFDDWYDLLPRIKCMTMLVRSSSHEGIPDEDFTKMQNLIPNCMAYEMSDPNHNVHLANKEEFYKYFDEFLARI